jgi:hypothetical protein
VPDEELDQLPARVGIDPPQAGDGTRQLEDGSRQLSGRVDPDHVIGSAADQEGPLEAARVQARCGAEGRDGRAASLALREVDEEVGGPGR